MPDFLADNKGHGLIDIYEEHGLIRVLTTYGNFTLIVKEDIPIHTKQALIDSIKKGRFLK